MLTSGQNSITTGTTGHVLGKKSLNLISEKDRHKLALLRGCPVNRGAPTTMTEPSFIKMCLSFQKKSGALDPSKPVKYSTTSMSGHFRSNNVEICPNCAIGKNVRTGKKFTPPRGLTLVDPETFGLSANTLDKPMELPTQVSKISNAKLTAEDVRNIRRMFDNGSKIVEIHTHYTQVSRKTISNIAKRVTWTHIK